MPRLLSDLYYACEEKDINKIKKILDDHAGANIRKAFVYSCTNRDIETTKFLFEYGNRNKWELNIHNGCEYIFRMQFDRSYKYSNLLNIDQNEEGKISLNFTKFLIEYCEKLNDKINIYTLDNSVFKQLHKTHDNLFDYLIYLSKHNYYNSNIINNIQLNDNNKKLLNKKYIKFFCISNYDNLKFNIYLSNNNLINKPEITLTDTYSLNYWLVLFHKK